MSFGIIDSLFENFKYVDDWLDILFIFVLISNKDLFGSISYLIILVVGSFVSFFIDFVRGLR